MAGGKKNKKQTAKSKTAKKPDYIKIPENLRKRAKLKPNRHTAAQFFQHAKPPPSVGPKEGIGPELLAMDQDLNDMTQWAGGPDMFFDGPLFIGYPELSILATMPEYRRMAEVLATECTRKWIKIECANADDEEKQKKLTDLEATMRRMDIRGAFRRLVELDAFFGRSHLFIDVGTNPDDKEELKTDIGNGYNEATKAKFGGQKDFLRGVKPIEPIWCYPANYNASNPLADDWYNPQIWYCQANQIHTSRLLRFVGREVPDMMKPAYMFGGISLSQLMKPYVDRWISTVQAVADLIVAFSIVGVKTNLSAQLMPDSDIFTRIEFFNDLRNNRGAMVLDKDTEDFFMFNVPLSTLDELMAQMQEHLCSMSGTPVVKLLGIQPAGLNASSEGEMTAWYDWVEAFQEKFCTRHLTSVMDFIQMSMWGVVDPDITFSWNSLRGLDPGEEGRRRKVQAETDQVYIETGVFKHQEIRASRMSDPASPYFGMEEFNETNIDPTAGVDPSGNSAPTDASGQDPDGETRSEPPAPSAKPPRRDGTEGARTRIIGECDLGRASRGGSSESRIKQRMRQKEPA